jgi:hypothetical protein
MLSARCDGYWRKWEITVTERYPHGLLAPVFDKDLLSLGEVRFMKISPTPWDFAKRFKGDRIAVIDLL